MKEYGSELVTREMVRKAYERLRDRDHLESAENEGLEEDVEQVEIECVEVSIG